MAVRVKICGVRDAASLERCVALGVDWLGFNFSPESRRWIDPTDAAELIASLPDDGPVPVGVFQDQAPNNVLRAARKAGVRVVQLHGSEPPAYCAAVAGPFDVWKALVGASVSDGALDEYAAFVDGFVLDGREGGSGRAWDYASCGSLFEAYDDLPVLLAGGLTPDSVVAAVEASGASAVDVASGVESDGLMTPERISAFVVAAREGTR